MNTRILLYLCYALTVNSFIFASDNFREHQASTFEQVMGVLFLEHMGGLKVFSCDNCRTYITNRANLISTRFTGATGRAYLFNKVVNLVYSDVQDRIMLTGRHLVRDALCKKCNMKLGWLYEHAFEEGQRYKEGRVILERALIIEKEGIPEV